MRFPHFSRIKAAPSQVSSSACKQTVQSLIRLASAVPPAPTITMLDNLDLPVWEGNTISVTPPVCSSNAKITAPKPATNYAGCCKWMTMEDNSCSKEYMLWREEMDRKGREKTGSKCHHSHFIKVKWQCKLLGKQKAVVDLGLRDGWD